MTRALKVWLISLGSTKRVVAATNMADAAHAIGHSVHSFRMHASTLDHDHEFAQVALANPGVGMERPITSRDLSDFKPVSWTYTPQSRLTKADRQARADRVAANEQRRAETRRVGEEAVERIRPMLVELGIHPDTVTVTDRGMVVPAEVLERLVRAATELDQVMS